MEVFKWNMASWKTTIMNLYRATPVFRVRIRVRLVGSSGALCLWSLWSQKDSFMCLGMHVLHDEVLMGEKDRSHSHMNSFFSRKPHVSRISFFLMSLKGGTFAGINTIHAGESPVSDAELNCNMWFLPFSWVRETLKLPLRSSIWFLRNPSEVYEPDPKLIAVGKIPDLSQFPVGLYKSYWSIYITFSRGKKKNHLSHTAKSWRLNF